MSEKQQIGNELRALNSLLVQVDNRPVFSVPDGFFDSFPNLMLARIKTLQPTMAGDQSINEDVVTELEGLSPLLAKLRGKNPLQVPDGYFAGDNIAMPEVTYQAKEPPSPQQPATVISMDRPGQRKNFLYAAASIIAILGLFTLFFALNRNGEEMSNTEIAAELPKLPESEIKAFLLGEEETLVLEPSLGPSLAGLDELEPEHLIKEINDVELQQFIADNPELLPGKLN